MPQDKGLFMLRCRDLHSVEYQKVFQAMCLSWVPRRHRGFTLKRKGSHFLLALWGDKAFCHIGKIGSDQPITKWEHQSLTRQWGFLHFWVLTVSQLGCKCVGMSDHFICSDFVYLHITHFLLFRNIFCWFTAGQCFLPILHKSLENNMFLYCCVLIPADSQVTTVTWNFATMEEHVWQELETIRSSVFVRMALVEIPATWQRRVRLIALFEGSPSLIPEGKLSSHQGPANLTPARTMGCVRSSLQPDEETFSMSTSASARWGLKECTARSVGYF